MAPGSRAVVALLLAVVAGCGSPAAPVSVTPVPVPSDVASTGSAPVETARVPGAFTDPESRAARHAMRLDGTTYTVVATTVVRYRASNLRVRTAFVGRFAGDGRYHVELERNGSAVPEDTVTDVAVHSDGDVAVRGVGQNPSATASVLPDAAGPPSWPQDVLPIDPRFRSMLAVTFGTTTIDAITRLQRGGHPHQRVLLEVSGPGDTRDAPSLQVVGTLGDPNATLVIESLAGRLIVDERGLVSRFELVAVGTIGGEPVIVTWHVRYVGLGGTTVEAPDWATRALEEGSPTTGNTSGEVPSPSSDDASRPSPPVRSAPTAPHRSAGSDVVPR